MYWQSYQIFFSIGLLNALLGILTWILYDFISFNFAPQVVHSYTMLGGFLMSFTLGFLMTSVPRMTGSKNPSSFEKILAAVLLTSFWPVGIFYYKYIELLFLAVSIFALYFVMSRKITGRHQPHEYFKFIALALVFAILGSTLENNWIVGLLFPLTLIIGVGGRLVAGLLGYQTQSPCASVAKKPLLSKDYLASNVQFVVQVLTGVIFTLAKDKNYLNFGFLILSLNTTWMCINVWKIHKGPAVKSKMAISIWLSVVFILSGLWISAFLSVFFPEFLIAGLHFIFVGGVAAITFMVATRISLAHGGYNLAFEYRSKFYLSWMALIMSAMALRIFGYIFSAAIVWMFAISVWGGMIWVKTIKKGKDPFGIGIAIK